MKNNNNNQAYLFVGFCLLCIICLLLFVNENWVKIAGAGFIALCIIIFGIYKWWNELNRLSEINRRLDALTSALERCESRITGLCKDHLKVSQESELTISPKEHYEQLLALYKNITETLADTLKSKRCDNN